MTVLKRFALAVSFCVVTAAVAAQKPAPKPPAPGKADGFSVVEASIADMRKAMEEGRTTSRAIVEQHLTRIAMYEDRLHAVITINPRALEIADERDRERREKKIRGPLHGIPIALKDNIHTTDMPTTGGALAFEGLIPPYEATLTKNLREAGAIIIAKTTLTELANWVANGMPGNYNGLVGYGMNPYDPRRDPREATFDGRPVMGTGGSSSGVGTSVSFWAANVGTETSGSILSPSNQNMLAGIKPTVGRVSRYGVIPITADQDTPGPMARNVSDAAIMLGALEGAQPDPNDPDTKRCTPPPGRDYTLFLKADGLEGARIGIPRANYYDKFAPPGVKEPRGGLQEPQAKIMSDVIDILKAQGAVIVDPADIPSVVTKDAKDNVLLWSTCAGPDNSKGRDADCSIVFKYGMKRDFNAWLKSLGKAAPVRTLTELRQWNVAHTKAGAIKYGQAQLDVSDEMDVELDLARYRGDRDKDIRLAGTNGIDAAMKAHTLDALLFPGPTGAAIAAKPGYPTVIVPFGMIPNAPTPPFPSGFTAKLQPFGVSFTGLACSEPRLIELAYAFEQATKKRVAPQLGPTTTSTTSTDFKILEATIPDMRAAMEQKRLTSRELVTMYLQRIATYEDKLNAAIAINPHALEIADERDRERALGKVRGPLHGIPIALKDNIHTTDMPTTGGALAFDGYVPPYEATLTKNLKDAGAIIIAKTGLTELANWVAGAPNPMPGNYNAVAGFAYNPYDPRRDPRDSPGDGRPVLQTGGSSSGIGTAANFWAGNVGSDTGGSIISPSNSNMLVGIRPTIGRISRYGVIPITADHDTAGPMTRAVVDAAIMLGALESPAPDPNDPATKACTPPPGRDYTKFLNAGGLKGARIGVPRAFYFDRITLTGDRTDRPEGIGPATGVTAGRGGLSPAQATLMADVIAVLKQQGAVIIDPADVPSLATKDPKENFAAWDFCSGAGQAKGKDENCSVNFKYGMKRDFNAWLTSLGPSAPVKTLTELREWNLAHQRAAAIKFGQSRFDISDEMDLDKDRARNEADVAKDMRLSRDQGIDGVLKAHKLDAILTPGGSGAGLASRAGYPIIVVPFGFIPNRGANAVFPEGFNPKPAPFGVGFVGTACSEPRLIELAYAFEQATKKRVPPPGLP